MGGVIAGLMVLCSLREQTEPVIEPCIASVSASASKFLPSLSYCPSF